jgi:hypothetical protein
MTDEIYRCNSCGKLDCDSHSEFLKDGIWYTDEEWMKKFGNEIIAEDEVRICKETGEKATSSIVYSTEWRD